MDKPQSKSVLLNHLPMELYQKIRKEAFKNEWSVSRQIREILAQYFKDTK